MDVLEIKIFECRANGQSKGYALVTFGSEGSMKLAGEQLDKTKIHNRIPTVKPDCKASSLYVISPSKIQALWFIINLTLSLSINTCFHSLNL